MGSNPSIERTVDSHPDVGFQQAENAFVVRRKR